VIVKRSVIAAVGVMLSLSVIAARPSAQQGGAAAVDPWYGKTTRLQFQPLAAGEPGFRIEWPKKDWMLLPAAGSLSAVIAAKKGDGMVVVERTELRQALEPGDITELFAQLESDAIKEKQKAIDVQARVIDAGDRRLVAVQYQRTGALGAERVRQYSVPVGKQLYRVTCISSAARFLTYDPVFAHMAASFVATPQ
jgi:hypothetical protein